MTKKSQKRQSKRPYDNGYKELFSNPRMVQDLLEGFLQEESGPTHEKFS